MDEGKGPLLVGQHPVEAVLGVLGQSRGLDRLVQMGVLLLDGVVPHPVPGLVRVGAQGEILPNPEINFVVMKYLVGAIMEIKLTCTGPPRRLPCS